MPLTWVYRGPLAGRRGNFRMLNADDAASAEAEGWGQVMTRSMQERDLKKAEPGPHEAAEAYAERAGLMGRRSTYDTRELRAEKPAQLPPEPPPPPPASDSQAKPKPEPEPDVDDDDDFDEPDEDEDEDAEDEAVVADPVPPPAPEPPPPPPAPGPVPKPVPTRARTSAPRRRG